MQPVLATVNALHTAAEADALQPPPEDITVSPPRLPERIPPQYTELPEGEEEREMEPRESTNGDFKSSSSASPSTPIFASASSSALRPPPRRTVAVKQSVSTSSHEPITSHAAPPRRTVVPHATSTIPTSAIPEKETWKQWSKRKGSGWGSTAVVKGTSWSDSIGGRINAMSARMGSEAFWPVTGDFPREMEKAARILKTFTVDGVATTIDEKDPKDGKKKQRKVLKKIPANVIREAKGLAIFTSMRSGIAPLGGAGGAGIVVAKLEDGTWSAPSSMSPNNLSAGFMIGVDVYDAVLIIRTQAALDSFATHKATLGTELGVAAGPWGAGAALELGKERSPVLSYIKSRGFFVGMEVVGQIFVERFHENGDMYSWPGVKAGDILSGKVKVPLEAASLHEALYAAESGIAQRSHGSEEEFEVAFPDISTLELGESEIMHLPPTPDQLSAEEEDELREINMRLREEELAKRKAREEEERYEEYRKAVEERQSKGEDFEEVKM